MATFYDLFKVPYLGLVGSTQVSGMQYIRTRNSYSPSAYGTGYIDAHKQITYNGRLVARLCVVATYVSGMRWDDLAGKPVAARTGTSSSATTYNLEGETSVVSDGGADYFKSCRVALNGVRKTSSVASYTLSFYEGEPQFAGSTVTLTAPQTYSADGKSYVFAGWLDEDGGTVDGQKITFDADASDNTAFVDYRSQFTVEFNANGGTGTMENQSFVYGVAQNLTRGTFAAPNLYAFDGWNTAADGSGDAYEDETDGSELTDTPGGSVTLYAQWRFIGFNLTATKTTSAGTLTLQKDGATVATESSGTLTYTGAVDGAEYRLVCMMADGFALPPMPVSPTEGASLSLAFANPLYFVSLPAEDASGNSFSVTSPAEPDGAVDGKDAYVAGRSVVVSANLGDEQMLTAAYLDDENHSNFATYTGESIAGSAFTITGIDRSCYVRGTFAVRQYSVTCDADTASASALAVAVSASSVVKNTQVTFTATPAAGYSFEGWYLDGVKIDGAGATYDRTITGETHLVAKAKVAVTLTLAIADTGTITVNDEAYTPGTPFDVTLGETFDYAIEPAEGLRYRGWYTSDYPTSKVRYPVSQRGTWPAPTASFTAVGVILAQAPVEPGTPLAVEIAFADGSDSTMGELSIDGGSELSIVKPYTEDEDTGEPTTYITLNAVAKNGYVFLGWYENAAGQGDAVKTPEYTFPLTEDVTLYAHFAQNDHSICEWEGSKTPKALVWRSKTYAASRPFNPSACRIDALGYPPAKLVELTVDMFSAPDAKAKPTASTTLTNIANQNARRLPVRRMERYMQIEVKANVEIGTLLVGTSMEGIAL